MQRKSIFVFTLVVVAVVLNLASPNFSMAGFDLKGTVTDSDGAPLADVVVDMYTARPRVGAGIL